MRPTGIALTALLVSALTCILAAAQQDVLFTADFEADTGGFVSLDPTAELSVTEGPERAFEGTVALKLRYVQAAANPDLPAGGFPGTLILPLPDGAEGLGEVSFALTSELSTPIIVVLVEGEDGPRYTRLLWSAAGTWQEFSLAVDDFIPDRDGPEDPNGRLDPEKVTGLAIFDADGLARMIGETTGMFHVSPPGEQTLRLDAFALRAGEPEEGTSPGGPTALADYSPPLQNVLPLGGQDVTLASEEQQDGMWALRSVYTAPAQTLFALVHTLAPGALDDVGAIGFQARTNRPVTLLVGLDERRGPGEINKSSYRTTLEVESADEFERVTIPLSVFELGDDQTDPDGELNAELVESLLIADITALTENVEIINTLRLRAPVAVD